ncbi:hypothetical protein BDV29DRAFT_113060 [Aspergillus leporis]|uniref:Aflatoxin regulatory protein domain-containing protein n=1 Tax=Aspergillus leporis TaxID=41062 RepID=A0A5N5X721_9EURO|nr:hypothetical protein BDV29DRAFT_113060 [Aspergillus leporis]
MPSTFNGDVMMTPATVETVAPFALRNDKSIQPSKTYQDMSMLPDKHNIAQTHESLHRDGPDNLDPASKDTSVSREQRIPSSADIISNLAPAEELPMGPIECDRYADPTWTRSLDTLLQQFDDKLDHPLPSAPEASQDYPLQPLIPESISSSSRPSTASIGQRECLSFYSSPVFHSSSPHIPITPPAFIHDQIPFISKDTQESTPSVSMKSSSSSTHTDQRNWEAEDSCISQGLNFAHVPQCPSTAPSTSCHCVQRVLLLNEEVEIKIGLHAMIISIDEFLSFQNEVLRRWRSILDCRACNKMSAVTLLLTTISERLLCSFQHLSETFADRLRNTAHRQHQRHERSNANVQGKCLRITQEVSIGRYTLGNLERLVMRLCEDAIGAGWEKYAVQLHYIHERAQQTTATLKNLVDQVL